MLSSFLRRPAAALPLLGGVLTLAGCAAADRAVAPDALVPSAQLAAASGPSVRISEFHYDNASTDVDERIEVSAPAGTDLSGWTIALYNGSSTQRNVYGTLSLSGVVADQCGGRGVVVVAAPGLQNGAPDGFALVDRNGAVVEFLSYEGTFEAASGPAAGLTSVDVGVAQSGSETGSPSLSRTTAAGSWVVTQPAGTNTFGACNDTGTEEPPAEVARVAVSPLTATVVRGGTEQLTATAFDASDAEIAGAAFTWSVADPAIASVSGTGLVTGLEVGETQVTATAGTRSATATVTVTAAPTTAAGARVVEFHYDNDGTDRNERIEIEGNAGASLAGWTLVLYSGSTGSSTAGQPYNTVALTGVFENLCDGRGVVVVDLPTNGLQNGNQDGMALVSPAGAVVEFLSYEGSFTATTGVAAGLTSTDVGVVEGSNTPADFSLQRARDGVWFGPVLNTFGACNAATAPPVPTGLVLEGYSFRGSDPLPVGFAELYRVKDVGDGSFVRSGISWSVAPAGVVAVDALGNVTAVGVGTATVTATEAATGRTASTSVTTTVFSYSDLSVYADELQFGTPTDGTPGDEYVVNRATFAASWNPTRGQPNWVAYNLEATHRIEAADRCDCFVHDPRLPDALPAVTTADYDGSGFTRGHMTMSRDRTRGALDNAETFYFSNIIPQTSANNGGPWLELEQYLGDLAVSGNKEIFIVAGGAAYSGTLNDAGRVAIPTRTWKVALILDRDEGVDDVARLADAEVIAVDMPNTTSVAAGWQQYRTTVDHIEALTGYDLLARLPDPLERVLEARAPGVRLVDMDLQPQDHAAATAAVTGVVLYSSANFDATAVDAADTRLVVDGRATVAPGRGNAGVETVVRDFDGDGRADRYIGFSMSALRAAGYDRGTASLVLRPLAGTWEAHDVAPALRGPYAGARR